MPESSQPTPIQRVLVVTAHPDDSEFGAGGTVAKLAREGKHVSYCIVTNGNKGSSDRSMTPERIARIREEEQRAATGGVADARGVSCPPQVPQTARLAQHFPIQG